MLYVCYHVHWTFQSVHLQPQTTYGMLNRFCNSDSFAWYRSRECISSCLLARWDFTETILVYLRLFDRNSIPRFHGHLQICSQSPDQFLVSGTFSTDSDRDIIRTESQCSCQETENFSGLSRLHLIQSTSTEAFTR